MEQRLSTSEKVRIELSRRKMTQNDLAMELGMNLMTLNRRIISNAWKPLEVFYMKNSLGFDL